jgi:hypothetical protein
MTLVSKSVSLAVIALSLALGGSAAAVAQDGHEGHHPEGEAAPTSPQAEPKPDKNAAPTDMQEDGMKGGMMGMMEGCPGMGMMAGRGNGGIDTQARLASVKATLAVTDAQEGLWSAYAAAVSANSENMKSMRQSMMTIMGATSPVERITLHLAAMDKRSAALKEVKDSLTNLYAVLSDDQKKTADRALIGLDCTM